MLKCDTVLDKLVANQSRGALGGVGRSCLRFLSQESDTDKSASECDYALKVIAKSS